MIPVDQFWEEGLAGWHFEGLQDAEEGAQYEDVSDCDGFRESQDGDDQALQHEEAIREQQEVPFRGDTVDDDAGDHGEQQHGEKLADADQADHEWRVGQHIHEPDQSRALHPHADEANGLADGKVTEIWKLKGSKYVIYDSCFH